MKKQTKIKIPQEFDLINILNQKMKDERISYEGAIVAFKLPDGNAGTWTICNDTGIRLRLLQECKIQENIADLSIKDIAQKTFLSNMPKVVNKEVSYLG